MKRLFAILAVAGVFSFGMIQVSEAQDTVAAVSSVQVESPDASASESSGLYQVMKERFVEGNVVFMSLMCIVLVVGLSLCIERLVFLSLSGVNVKKLLSRLEDALEKGDIEGARNVCRNTRGPVAAICYQGLARIDENPDVVERAVDAYAKVQVGRLTKGCSWIALLVKVSSMLGVFGMLVGFIFSLDAVQEAGKASLVIMADGIKMALIAFAFGLIVYIVLRIFYSFIQYKIENLSNQMRDAFISLFDMIMTYNLRYKK